MSDIAFAMAVAQRPGAGGHTWVALQYLLGFRRLGLDVTLVDRLEPEFCHDAAGNPCEAAESVNAVYLGTVMESFGLEDSWTLLLPDGETLGLSRPEVESRLDSSSILLNVMGYLEDEDLLARPAQNVFLDIDPGFPQMWRELGLHDAFAGHDRFVTVGLRLGEPDCLVPDCGLDWIATLPPVVLDEWPVAAGGRAYTSVASWRGAFGPIAYADRTFGLRVHEFRKFFALPGRTDAEFELALEIDSADSADIEQLRRNGWDLRAPDAVAGDPVAYRDYVGGSLAELMVAKNMYVDTRGGWFSDRSACYLASGKPVLAQETGFSRDLPTGEGLLAFSTLEEAVAGVEAIGADRARHAAAAREFAEQHLDAERVLGRLLGKLGVG